MTIAEHQQHEDLDRANAHQKITYGPSIRYVVSEMARGRRDTVNHEEILWLLNQLFDKEDIDRMHRIVDKRKTLLRDEIFRNDPIAALYPQRDEILPLDSKIGGKGIDDLVFGKGQPLMGNYGGDRNTRIYRPLSYAILRVIFSHPTDPRGSIGMSCEHIENVLKDRLGNLDSEFLRDLEEEELIGRDLGIKDSRSMGILVNEVERRRVLDVRLIAQLRKINRIFRIAKHEYGQDSVKITDVQTVAESRVFNDFEAVSMYFVCRKIGALLLGE